ncbi:hypothetical protein EV1_008339 [Malus domestica]
MARNDTAIYAVHKKLPRWRNGIVSSHLHWHRVWGARMMFCRLHMSKFSLCSDDRQKSGLDPISDIYSILRDEYETTGKQDVSYANALNLISRKGKPAQKR